jgi:hypothetical protein
VSAIVPTKNVGRTIRGCLESIRQQDHPDLELIVVDNHSTDDTLAIARELADVAVLGGPERSAQRNQAIALARGDWILWIDADMRLTGSVVSSALGAAHRDGAVAVFIPEVSVGEGFWTACRALERRCYIGEPMIEAPRLVRREFFERSGGFVAEVAGQEDAELRMRLLASGAPLAWSEAPIEHDEGRLTFLGVMRKRLYYGRSIPAYAAAAPGAVPAQGIATIRAYARHWRLLATHPVHAAGMLFLRGCEAVAYGIGAARARIAARQAAA